MASQLPAVPRAIFTLIEPISLLAGCFGALIDPEWFIKQQIPASTTIASKLGSIAASPAESDSARLVALQLGNTYGLVFLIGVGVLYSTSEIKVVRAYLTACLIADVTHVGLTCWGLGYDRTMDFASWSATTWGNIAFTIFLGLTRTAYFLGLFGPNGSSSTRTPLALVSSSRKSVAGSTKKTA
ncbi:uncharacterized protein B0I36DRAFT_313407 [Microdochium trichocladiopsis]|uniref:DUF7704 domain-containing protein n=1 Tax=Microdochium trichocladiopsis TaxID=1682393 RepID=A0A9P9BU64_9PEZI|nr:uncharacterized protein B0I36DRAFT_313407 [Microdochium trichocladiopsis]KAH7037139.1 hypothetical protein B0I36DRAFT_313407 [Microdochium trichocladiopsis]